MRVLPLAVVLSLIASVPAKPAQKADDDVWWKTAVFYQIYPMSFKDSDNNGKGDFKGITEKLNHLKNSGIDGAWLSSIFKSPMVDMGYDISDFYQVNDIYGTMQDFEDMLAEAKRLGVKIVLDFVPNHTSDKHEWWSKSVKKEPGFEDFYVWYDCKVDGQGNAVPLNNWKSNFGGSVWTYHPDRKQCYLHQFDAKQPDLNYRNPKVVEEMQKVLRFWLDKGIDGFRVDAVPHLVEDDQLRDEPKKPNAPNDDYDSLFHIYTKDLPETYNTVFGWRAIFDEFKAKDGYERVLMTECYGTLETITAYYGNSTHPGASFSFNFEFLRGTSKDSPAAEWKNVIDGWEEALDDDLTSNWVLGNHDNWRVATKYGKEKTDGLNMLIMTLPGVGVNYNGEEIGMENGEVSWEQTVDPKGINAGPDHYREYSRDFERTPLHWDDSTNGGFNIGGTPWLPVSELYKTNNVAAQTRAHESHLKVYQGLTSLRKTSQALRKGTLGTFALGKNTLGLTRTSGEETVFTVFNLGNQDDSVKLADMKGPTTATVAVASVGSVNVKGTKINDTITLKPYEALVLISS